MVSIVMRIYQRKHTIEAHAVVGEESRPEIGLSVQSIRRAYWKGDIPAYRICKMLRFDLERVQRIFLAKGLPVIVRGIRARSGVPACRAQRRIAPGW